MPNMNSAPTPGPAKKKVMYPASWPVGTVPGTVTSPAATSPAPRGEGAVSRGATAGSTGVGLAPKPFTNVGGGPNVGGPSQPPAPRPTHTPPNIDLVGLFKSMMPQPGAHQPGIVNTAAEDPNLKDYLDRIKKRLDDPEGGKRAIDIAGSAIRDLGEGEKSALQAGAARRGVLSSSSIPQIGEAAISQNVQSNVAKAASDIALGRERDKDAILSGAGGAFGAIGGAQRADRGLALNQWQAGEQARQAQQQGQMQQWLGSLDLLTNLMRL